MTRAPSDRLADIAQSISRIHQALPALAAAENDEAATELHFDAILYRLIVIGEAVKALPEEWKASEPSIPWAEICKLRDLLVHHYHRIATEVIRKTIFEPLRELDQAVARLAENPPSS